MADTRQADGTVTTWLDLDGALNLRDLGGLPVSGGGVIRSRTLLRSASLRLLPPAAAARLIADYGLRTVIDLRSPAELSADGPSTLASAGVATVHLPLIGDVDTTMERARLESDPAKILAKAYQSFLDDRGEHLVTAARLVAWTGSGSVLVHCSAGKDRTGVTIALLLEAVGVPRASVLADYNATNQVIGGVIDTLAQAMGTAEALNRVPLALREAQPDALRAILERIDREYGGARGWLRARGFEPVELELLGHRLVEPR
ncbi:MAG TPA: tyrosine-protein phosphatase [Pseudonocardia sp.]|jgi:protein tyrosine/serine phosphatase